MKRFLLMAIALLAFTACEKSAPDIDTSKKVDVVKGMAVPSDFDWKTMSNVTFNFTALHASKVAVAVKKGAEPFATFVAGGNAEPVMLSVPRAARTLYVSYENISGGWSGSTLPVAERIPFRIPDDSRVYALQTRAGASEGFITYPDSGMWGTLMFEDLWPGYGDYDFNDMVVNYSVRQILQEQNKVGSMLVTLRIKAVGGSLPFDFYMGIPAVSAEGIGKVEITSTENTTGTPVVTLLTDSAYAGGAATLEVTGIRDNARKPSGSIYLNTQKGYEVPEADLVWVTFEVTFKDPINMQYLTLDIFDFFIGRTDDLGRRIEIHMGDYKPSVAAFSDYNMIHDGNVNIGKASRPYFSNSNLVWGLNIPYDVKQGYESVDFLKAYPEFKVWAQSGGLLSQDWYMHGVEYNLVQSTK